MDTPTGALDGPDPVDPVDPWLRQRLTTAVRSDEDPLEVFAELAPVFAGARRRQRIREVALSTAAAILVVGGIGALGADRLRDGGVALTEAAGDPQLSGAGPALVVEVAEGPLEVTGTTDDLVDQPTTEAPPEEEGDPAETSSSTESGVVATVLGNTTVNDDVPATPPPTAAPDSTPSTRSSTTERPTTTEATPTTRRSHFTTSTAPPVPGAKVFHSSCGSIEAAVVDGRIEVIRIDAKPGYTAKVEGSGKEELEVKLRNSHRKCEFKLRLHHGSLSGHEEE